MSTNFLDLPEPRSLQDTGIGGDQIEQLLVKTLYSGEATGLEIADKMCLPFHYPRAAHRAPAQRAPDGSEGLGRLRRVNLSLCADRQRT
jgi:hypothetical protein